MFSRVRPKLTYASVAATLALITALGGGASAAASGHQQRQRVKLANGLRTASLYEAGERPLLKTLATHVEAARARLSGLKEPAGVAQEQSRIALNELDAMLST